eukprot:UN09168
MKTKQKETQNIRFNTFKLVLWIISLLMILLNIISTQSQQKMNISHIVSNDMYDESYAFSGAVHYSQSISQTKTHHGQEISTKKGILRSKKILLLLSQKMMHETTIFITPYLSHSHVHN